MNGTRFAIFLMVVLAVWMVMHVYVFWRLVSVPWITSLVSPQSLIIIAVLLWLSYPLARILGARHWTVITVPLEYMGAIWIGTLFLMFSVLLALDVVTLCGALLSRWTPLLRGGAVAAALAMAAVAVAQGHRPPVLREEAVTLAGLPPAHDGLKMIVISDLHLGALTTDRWIRRLVHRINALKPDIVMVAGDLVDGNVDHIEDLAPLLRELRAPLGVWAVTGNHEYYAGLDRSVRFLEACGFHVLRDRWQEVVPGLVVAGVDDLPARRQMGDGGNPLEDALAHMPVGGRILLSHSPVDAEKAAAHGVGLMVSGHTHNGQIWPFTHIVAMVYPRISGWYDVDGMTLIVGRGTGTWGPPMRLWKPSEIIWVTLRSGLM